MLCLPTRANEPWLAVTFWLLEQCFCEHGCAKNIFKGHSCGLLPQATTSQHQPCGSVVVVPPGKQEGWVGSFLGPPVSVRCFCGSHTSFT